MCVCVIGCVRGPDLAEDILLQGAIDVLFFVLGCALFASCLQQMVAHMAGAREQVQCSRARLQVVEGERFFRRQNHEDPKPKFRISWQGFGISSLKLLRIARARGRTQSCLAAWLRKYLAQSDTRKVHLLLKTGGIGGKWEIGRF